MAAPHTSVWFLGEGLLTLSSDLKFRLRFKDGYTCEVNDVRALDYIAMSHRLYSQI